MKHFALLLFACCLITNSTAQNIEFAAGLNVNKFRDVDRDFGDLQTVSEMHLGYSAGIRYTHDRKKYPLKFSFGFDNYNGSFQHRLQVDSTEEVALVYVNKHSLNLGFYPLNYTFFERLEVSFGGEFNFLLMQKTGGNQYLWERDILVKTSHLNTQTLHRDKSFNLGLSSRIAYSIPLYKDWSLVPQYLLYWSLTNDFIGKPDTKSVRHRFEIGFQKSL